LGAAGGIATSALTFAAAGLAVFDFGAASFAGLLAGLAGFLTLFLGVFVAGELFTMAAS
jgi:hypothetical protein